MARLLHPTLWRTCRVLSGKTRLELLRLVIDRPDQTVSGLAHSLKISLPRASQELRRLQSRGLIQAVATGLHVRYRPVPDPLVATAAPLVQAMRAAFQRQPPPADEETSRIATGFSHVRRLALARLLLIGPMNTQTLEELSGLSRNVLNRHLRRMRDAGVVRRLGQMNAIADHPHPLAQCLLGILKDSPARAG